MQEKLWSRALRHVLFKCCIYVYSKSRAWHFINWLATAGKKLNMVTIHTHVKIKFPTDQKQKHVWSGLTVGKGDSSILHYYKLYTFIDLCSPSAKYEALFLTLCTATETKLYLTLHDHSKYRTWYFLVVLMYKFCTIYIYQCPPGTVFNWFTATIMLNFHVVHNCMHTYSQHSCFQVSRELTRYWLLNFILWNLEGMWVIKHVGTLLVVCGREMAYYKEFKLRSITITLGHAEYWSTTMMIVHIALTVLIEHSCKMAETPWCKMLLNLCIKRQHRCE